MSDLNQIKGNIYTSIIRGVRGSSNRNIEDWDIHASEISTFCPKQYLLCKKYGKPFHKNDTGMPLGLAVTFQIGLAVEEYFVRSMEHNDNLTTLFCYECPKCGRRYLKNNKETKLCDKCKIKLLRKQIALKFKVLDNVYINGHPDLVMNINSLNNVFNIFELKTINPDDYDKLNRPIINHEYQLKTYLWLLAHSKRHKLYKYNVDTNIGYIVYTKKTFDKEPLKIFQVEKDKDFDKEMKSIVMQLRGKEKLIKICNSKDSIIARNCPVRNYCWRR